MGRVNLGRDGRSIMPTYGDMTMRQLCDLVAYLKSLKSGGTDHVHRIASTYYVEVDRVTAGQIEAFDDWFAQDGVQTLNAINGFVSLDTYVDRSPGDRTLVRVYGFDSEAGLGEFLRWRASPTAASELGDAAAIERPAPLRSPALYKAVGLSLP